MKRELILLSSMLLLSAGCGGSGGGDSSCLTLSDSTKGCIETVDNIRNLTVASKDSNDLRAEYNAGFIQGHLQKDSIKAARENVWDNFYITDPSHSYPKQEPPSAAELSEAQQILLNNLRYTANYTNSANSDLRAKLSRLLFRMLGISDGIKLSAPANRDFSGQWLPSPETLNAEDLVLSYETPVVSFLDIYFINANQDLADVVSYLHDFASHGRAMKCSAFVKRTGTEIFIAHNNWNGYLSQTMAHTLAVNNTFMTFNAMAPGMIASYTDFGYNKQGMLFNETTHHATYSEPKVDALWMFARAALAEQFASSLDEFYQYLSLEASGTYMNGYMIVDAKTKEFGLVEMSYKSFVYFKTNSSGGIDVQTKPETASKEYDTDMVTKDDLLGINYPASYQIRDDLQAIDTRPARKRQFLAQIGGVDSIESAKALITYIDPANPLSIYGRWDLGYGETPLPKTVPDGAVDAKVATASMAAAAMDIQGVLDLTSARNSIWMKFGTAKVDGKPFIWSESQWSGQKLRDVPDALDGDFELLKMNMK